MDSQQTADGAVDYVAHPETAEEVVRRARHAVELTGGMSLSSGLATGG